MNKKSNDYILSLGSVFASLGAILATSCCIIPLILANLGLGGVWIAKLAVLQPYRVYLLVGGAFLSGAGGLLYIRNRSKSCETCPPKRPVMKIAVPLSLAVSVLLIILAMVLPGIEPQLLRALR